MITFLVAVIAFLIGTYVGYGHAHIVVADECERLGKFFVNKNVYHCTKVEWAHKEPQHEKAE